MTQHFDPATPIPPITDEQVAAVTRMAQRYPYPDLMLGMLLGEAS